MLRDQRSILWNKTKCPCDSMAKVAILVRKPREGLPCRPKGPRRKRSKLQAGIPAQNGAVRFPVVGIGASAGGLEAATSFFKELSPHLGIAYVLVLHLDPARESKVTEILGRAHALSVFQVEDGMTCGAGSRLRHSAQLRNDHRPHWVLHLRNRDPQRSANTTIDTFLRSLAVAHGSDAIAVILSGTASDGTLGCGRHQGRGGHYLRPGTKPPPSTMACRRAPSPLVVSTSS